jgi:hypothetical protein
MSAFVQSLKRLYAAERITQQKLTELQTNGKITQEELNYILN